MKKIFEKHAIAKILCICLFVVVALTWFIPNSMFQGTELIETSSYHIGFDNLATIFSTSFNFIIDKIIFVLVLGGFYAVLSKTDGYKKIVGNIVKKIKGKEVLFVIGSSILIALLTSVLTQSFVVFIFIPMLLTIMLNAGINKITSFASTFGAMLVGIIGATFGFDGLLVFNLYFSNSLQNSGFDLTLLYRTIILVISLVLYNFFLYFGVKKSLAGNSKKVELEDAFIIENVKDKKAKKFPVIFVLSLLTIFVILGFVDWNGIFKTNIFTNFHNWLVDLKIGNDYKIMSYILGDTIPEFGTWSLLQISMILIILSVITSLLCSVKFDDLLSEFGKGALRLVKPIAAVVLIYAIFVTAYMGGITPKIADTLMHKDNVPNLNIDYNGSGFANFNIDIDNDGKADLNLVNEDIDDDGKCDLNCDVDKDGFPDKNIDLNGDGKSDENDESIMNQIVGTSTLNLDTDGDGIADVNVNNKFNLARVVLGATVVNTINTDLGFTGYALGEYLVGSYGGANLKLIFLVFVSIYGLLQFFVPTSMILIFGLVYTKTSYKEWFKYIWRFVAGILCILLLIFIFMLII